MPFLTVEQLSPKQSMTPEGFLLCEGVPIARTGSQLYAGHELPDLEPGPDGLIKVVREEADVFRPETMASFEGKSITIRHTFVDSGNVRMHEVGHAQNIRRSTDEPDLLLADFLIKDAHAIRTAKSMREVSCGYDADYEQDTPGLAYQRNIIGNHVALVERGRAGPRCSIQDEEIMSKPKNTLLARLLLAVRSGDAALQKRVADEAEAEEAAEEQRVADEAAEEEKKKTTDAIAKLTQTVDSMGQILAKLVKSKDEEVEDPSKAKKVEDEETDPDAKKTMDAALCLAEVLAPGIRVMTGDTVATLRKAALVQAARTPDTLAVLQPLLAGRTVDALTDDAAAVIFAAGAQLMKAKNTGYVAVHSGARTRDFGAAPITPAEINKANAEFWKSRA